MNKLFVLIKMYDSNAAGSFSYKPRLFTTFEAAERIMSQEYEEELEHEELIYDSDIDSHHAYIVWNDDAFEEWTIFETGIEESMENIVEE